MAFETSCDDTSVAIIDTKYNVKTNLISSQPIHNEYGGVVPELASRLHLKNIMYLSQQALSETALTFHDIDAFAVSVNPGLIGSLLVGVSFVKSLAYSSAKPLIAVNHIVGHVYANYINNPELQPPYLALIVSGGHSELVDFKTTDEFEVVGRTRDDAAGEAFDKTAKLLSLGYPGGPAIDRLAEFGDPQFVDFPRALKRNDDYDFSFSGLKTAIINYLSQKEADFIEKNVHNITASVQAAIVDPLVKKTINYAKKTNQKRIVVAGGVSANRYLRNKMNDLCKKNKIELFVPPLRLCMDNAAMIGAAAVDKYLSGNFADLTLNAFSTKGLRLI